MITGPVNGDLNNNRNYNPYSTNTDDNLFIELIKNRITGYGQIPYTVPTKLIIDVIKSSAKWFYEWHSRTWQQKFYAIKKSDIIKTTGYNMFNSREIKIDPRIIIINKIYEASPYYAKNDDFNMFDVQSTIAGSYIATNSVGINNNMFLIENAVKMVEISALQNMFKTTLSYFHSWENASLIFKTEPKAGTLIIDCLACLDIKVLYKMAFFERHVIANVKRELKRIVGTHTITLPGGATLNIDELCNNIEDAQDIEEKIKASNGIGDIIVTRGK